MLRYVLKFLPLQTWSHAAISSPVPIAPGLFKGEYNELGSKCTELIFLSYHEDSNNLTFTGRKITGDTHVPAGKRSFQGSLNDCLKMKLDEQVVWNNFRNVFVTIVDNFFSGNF